MATCEGSRYQARKLLAAAVTYLKQLLQALENALKVLPEDGTEVFGFLRTFLPGAYI